MLLKQYEQDYTMKEQEKLERLRNVAEACAKSGVRDHNEYGISYDSVERMAVTSLFLYFSDDTVITDGERDYFLTYLKENMKKLEEKVK